MSAPQEILDLVKRFEERLEQLKKSDYKEAELCTEFLLPLFDALGWDVSNKRGVGEVRQQQRLGVARADEQKAPDYNFSIGNELKFYLDAKRPQVPVATHMVSIRQVRRYGWSKKLLVSIVSDFEHLAIYDTRYPLRKSDGPDTALAYRRFSFRDYEENWDELVKLLGRDSVAEGSLEKLVGSKKKGIQPVDEKFLDDLEAWRALLAKDLHKRNSLSKEQLNDAVQRILDRVVFLRIGEDRGFEVHNQLRDQVQSEGVWERFQKLFRESADRYDSELFSAPLPVLEVGDDVLKDIIAGLYEPAPYEFSVISPDILGSAYERFLGKVIEIDGRGVRIENNEEESKEAGVYYTPAYVVEYIVKNTVGRLLEGKTPDDVSEITIVDPACGSGSFLIGAFQCLIDWHIKCYRDQGDTHLKGKDAALRQLEDGTFDLTVAEKRRILLNNIYGVDVDRRAVEVAKLSLSLKLLENEHGQMQLFKQERVLPDMGKKNIKCGNSLVGTDYCTGKSTQECAEMNAFDWDGEAGFPEIFKRGGFDAVIGNPPYVRQETISGFKDYLEEHYEAYDGVADLYAYFMERSAKYVRAGGYFSFIVSSSFLRATYGLPLRRVLKEHVAVLRIVDFGGLAVFDNAKDTYVCIPLFAKIAQPDRVEVSRIPSLEVHDLDAYVSSNHFTIPHERLSDEAWALKSDEEAAVFNKVLKAGKPLGDYVERKIFYGIKTGLNEAFVIDAETKKKLIAKDQRSAELIHPLLGGEDIRRYTVRESTEWLIFTRRGVDIASYPAVREHLERWKEDLTPKRDKTAKHGRKPGHYEWYEIQDDVAYWEAFDKPKIIYPDICKEPRFYLDTAGHYLANTAYCLGTDDRYLLGVLNSRLFWFAIGNLSIPFGVRAGKYRYRLIYQYMEKIPIRVLDLNDREDKERHDRIVALVGQTLDLHQKQAVAEEASEQTTLTRQIFATDAQIDQLVYKLYGLAEEDIRVVEESTT